MTRSPPEEKRSCIVLPDCLPAHINSDFSPFLNCIFAILYEFYFCQISQIIFVVQVHLEERFEACLGIRVNPSHLNFTSLPLLN